MVSSDLLKISLIKPFYGQSKYLGLILRDCIFRSRIYRLFGIAWFWKVCKASIYRCIISSFDQKRLPNPNFFDLGIDDLRKIQIWWLWCMIQPLLWLKQLYCWSIVLMWDDFFSFALQVWFHELSHLISQDNVHSIYLYFLHPFQDNQLGKSVLPPKKPIRKTLMTLVENIDFHPLLQMMFCFRGEMGAYVSSLVTYMLNELIGFLVRYLQCSISHKSLKRCSTTKKQIRCKSFSI